MPRRASRGALAIDFAAKAWFTYGMSFKLIQNAKRLLGDERGTLFKPHGDYIKFALAFPNSYRLGMSNLGYQLVYRLLNERADTVCERTFLPDPADEQEHRRSHTPLLSLESQRP